MAYLIIPKTEKNFELRFPIIKHLSLDFCSEDKNRKLTRFQVESKLGFPLWERFTNVLTPVHLLTILSDR